MFESESEAANPDIENYVPSEKEMLVIESIQTYRSKGKKTQTNINNISRKTGIPYNDVGGILRTLKRENIVSVTNFTKKMIEGKYRHELTDKGLGFIKVEKTAEEKPNIKPEKRTSTKPNENKLEPYCLDETHYQILELAHKFKIGEEGKHPTIIPPVVKNELNLSWSNTERNLQYLTEKNLLAIQDVREMNDRQVNLYILTESGEEELKLWLEEKEVPEKEPKVEEGSASYVEGLKKKIEDHPEKLGDTQGTRYNEARNDLLEAFDIFSEAFKNYVSITDEQFGVKSTPKTKVEKPQKKHKKRDRSKHYIILLTSIQDAKEEKDRVKGSLEEIYRSSCEEIDIKPIKTLKTLLDETKDLEYIETNFVNPSQLGVEGRGRRVVYSLEKKGIDFLENNR